MSYPPSTSRRRFIKYGVAGAVGFGVASAIEIPILQSQVNSRNDEIEQKNQQISQLQSEHAAMMQAQGFLTLNPVEQQLVQAIADTIIPADSNGPNATEAGVVYFIDRMLAGNYGKGGNMYLQGPFIVPKQGELTVMGSVYPNTDKTAITYSEGTITPRLQAGTAYQYAFNPREFWRRGLMYFQGYCNSAYGGDFQGLSSDQKIQVLQDLFDNKAEAAAIFGGPRPDEFFNELHDIVTAGYWTDPLYGGNINMVGWQLLASTGVNMGTAQGYAPIQLATSNQPIPIPPLSLSQLQQGGTM